MTRVDLVFPSMGGEAMVRLESATLDRAALERLADRVHARIETVEAALSRFRPGSELNALNADPRPAVPASPLMRRTVAAAALGGRAQRRARRRDAARRARAPRL